MRTIYKYPLPFNDISEVQLPKDAKILSVGAQGNSLLSRRLMLWVLVESNQTEMSTRTFRILGTGHPFDLVKSLNQPTQITLCDVGKEKQFGETVFIGTVQASTDLVWHVFELT